ncbi:MAG: ABC transporter ATP-binding protein [Clostridium sp.]|nr:ABC transporter ATP-binding protein [Clostridium sp.]
MIAVECKEVTKKFADKTVLDRISFQLEKGKIYALLGRNGSGKTTLMNCICTKYLPNSGEIRVLEEAAYENEHVLSRICFMSDNIDAFETKKVRYILHYAGNFYRDWNRELEKRLLDFFGIDPKDTYGTLAKGQKTMVGIIIGLCSSCEIVLLDEIYSGLDTTARQSLYKILLDEQERLPRTFILSTHLIEEMTALFDRVVILDKGRVMLNEDMETIYSKSYKCVGRTDRENCLAGKQILYRKQMGTVTEYDIYDAISGEDQKQLAENGFTVSPLPLQDLFTAMTLDGAKEWGDFDEDD